MHTRPKHRLGKASNPTLRNTTTSSTLNCKETIQHWVTFYFLLMFSLLDVFTPLSLLLSCHCTNLADTFHHRLIFPPPYSAAKNIFHNYPLWQWWPPDGHSLGFTEDACNASTLWSRQNERMLYTGKEEGGGALSVLSGLCQSSAPSSLDRTV